MLFIVSFDFFVNEVCPNKILEWDASINEILSCPDEISIDIQYS